VVRAIEVSKFLLYIKHQDPRIVELTNLKLQKLLYYCQGYYLLMYGKPLFDEEIEAWKYGPVVPSVYFAYNQYGNMDIADKYDIDEIDLDNREKSVVAYVWKLFGGFKANQLVDKTHSESPWLESWFNPKDKTIDNNTIRDYFLKNFNNRLYVNTEV
jgi:uncharacterized phage-associated protein